MRRICATLTTLLLILPSAFGAAPEHIKNLARGMGDAGVLSARAKGTTVFSASNLRRVGGVLFQGTVEDEDFVSSIVEIRVNRKDETGFLDLVLENERTVSYAAPYWLLSPAILYSGSADNGVVSLFGEPSEEEMVRISPEAAKRSKLIDQYNSIIREIDVCRQEYESTGHVSEQCIELAKTYEKSLDRMKVEIEKLDGSKLQEYLRYYFFVDVHPMIKNSALGFRLLQADSLPMDTSYTEIVSLRGQPAEFPLEIGVPRNSTDQLNTRIRNALFDCEREAGNQSVQAWILTDVNTTYTVRIDESQLIIDGLPYYYVWGAVENGDPFEIEECTAALRNLRGEFATKSPRTWGAAVHLARVAALLRGIRESRPELLTQLSQAAKTEGLNLSYPTPRAWPRGGYEEL